MQASHAWTVGSFCEVEGLCVPVPSLAVRQSARCNACSCRARSGDSTCVLTLRSAALATTARQKGLRAPGFLRKWSVRPPALTAPTLKFDMQRCVKLALSHVGAKTLRLCSDQMLDSDDSLLREEVQLPRCVPQPPRVRVADDRSLLTLIHALIRLRPAQPAHLLRVSTLKVGLPVDVYAADIWWEGYLRCESVATAESPGEWHAFCHHTNDTVSVNVAAWEVEVDGAPPSEGMIRAGLFWNGGSWYHRPSMDGLEGARLAVAASIQAAQPSRPVRRQLVADPDQDGSEPVAKPLFTPTAIETLFLTRRRLQALLSAPGNDAAAVCRIISGALVRTFDDPESPYASRLWIVASASVHGTAGGLASIELFETGSIGCSHASALCNMAPSGHDVAALMALPAFDALTFVGCRETAARLAAAQGKCRQSARSAIQPADAASHATLAARYANSAHPVFGSLPGVIPHAMQSGAAAQSRRAMSAAALLLRPCTFHRCRNVPAAMAFPRYCYYPPPPAERVPSGPFCVACLSQWSRQMQDDFGLWPEGGGPPASVTYGTVMRDARAAGALP